MSTTGDSGQEIVYQFLKGESIFSNVGGSALAKLATLGRIQAVRGGKKLFCMGQPCDALHFLVRGQASVSLLSEDGRERMLHLVLPGDMVGAVPFFDGGDYPCTATAEVDCQFVAFGRRELLKLLSDDGQVTLAILGGLVVRQRKIVHHLEELSFEDTSSRLWHYLVENSSGADSSFPRVFEPLPTREKIAGAIGTVREVVSRRLSQLIRSGHISIDGRKLILHKRID